ncbi:hypothetical protein AB0H34_24210 [Saccharopolyspora shandongensis]
MRCGQQHQRRTTYVYNADGTVKETTVDDAVGTDALRTTAYTYDNCGRVYTVTDPERGVTRTEYDQFGEAARLRSARCSPTSAPKPATNSPPTRHDHRRRVHR